MLYAPTERTTVRRPERGVYDVEVVHAILDEALTCHVGFVVGAQPYVIPTIHARIGDTLFLHGAAATRMFRELRRDVPVCVTVTLVDGLVLARSAFHHSMNYRSVVILGAAREVTDAGEKIESFRALVEHVVPGRWDDVRRPSNKEFARTQVLALPITESSAKVRTGPPIDDVDDHSLPVWAGVIPLRLEAGAPIADPLLPPGINAPDYARAYLR